jgi:hypothetical protein
MGFCCQQGFYCGSRLIITAQGYKPELLIQRRAINLSLFYILACRMGGVYVCISSSSINNGLCHQQGFIAGLSASFMMLSCGAWRRYAPREFQWSTHLMIRPLRVWAFSEFCLLAVNLLVDYVIIANNVDSMMRFCCQQGFWFVSVFSLFHVLYMMKASSAILPSKRSSWSSAYLFIIGDAIVGCVVRIACVSVISC